MGRRRLVYPPSRTIAAILGRSTCSAKSGNRERSSSPVGKASSIARVRHSLASKSRTTLHPIEKLRPSAEILLDLGRNARFPATFLIDLDQFCQDAATQRIVGQRNQRTDIRWGACRQAFSKCRIAASMASQSASLRLCSGRLSRRHGGVVSFVFIALPSPGRGPPFVRLCNCRALRMPLLVRPLLDRSRIAVLFGDGKSSDFYFPALPSDNLSSRSRMRFNLVRTNARVQPSLAAISSSVQFCSRMWKTFT